MEHNMHKVIQFAKPLQKACELVLKFMVPPQGCMYLYIDAWAPTLSAHLTHTYVHVAVFDLLTRRWLCWDCAKGTQECPQTNWGDAIIRRQCTNTLREQSWTSEETFGSRFWHQDIFLDACSCLWSMHPSTFNQEPSCFWQIATVLGLLPMC